MGRMTAFTRRTFRAWQAAGCGLCILCEINFHQQNKAIFGWRQGVSGNSAEWADQQELVLWVQSSGLCFCPSADVLGLTSGRSNMVVNVKAHFLDDCFINVINVYDSCRVTRKQPGDGCGCGVWHSLKWLERGRREQCWPWRKRAACFFLFELCLTPQDLEVVKLAKEIWASIAPWSCHWKLPEPWRYWGVYLEALLSSGPFTSISAK